MRHKKNIKKPKPSSELGLSKERVKAWQKVYTFTRNKGLTETEARKMSDVFVSVGNEEIELVPAH